MTEEAKPCPKHEHMRVFTSLAILICFLSSCVSNKELTRKSQYFTQISDSLLAKAATEHEPVFQKGDILSIAVITPNELSSRLFNQPNGTATPQGEATAGAGNVAQANGGYLINEKGNITLPLFGSFHAEGFTRQTLTDTLTNKLSNYLDSPIVSIRLMNYKITVLGEVARPGTFSIPSERITILDALGLSGDLTIYGKRNNIRVIRTVNGTRETGVLDLNKGDIFNSPFFNLRQNDIVYVEMNDRKIPNTDQASLRNVSIALGIISALGVLISTINVLQ